MGLGFRGQGLGLRVAGVFHALPFSLRPRVGYNTHPSLKKGEQSRISSKDTETIRRLKIDIRAHFKGFRFRV